ncbi:MAG: hypothetical protein ACTSQI_21070 [Candidatus Helarchaeota archaeon]
MASVNACKECRNGTFDFYHLCDRCFKTLLDKIVTKKLSDVSNIQDIFPEFMIKEMDDFLKKDIDESIKCLKYKLWTAAVLMFARIYEIILKTHLKNDLDYQKDFRNIGKSIKELAKHYPPELIAQLNDLRGLRNEAMHGKKRFSSKMAINIWHKVFSIVAGFYNLNNYAEFFRNR